MERSWLSGKKKFHALWSVKKVMLVVFWDVNRPITTDFPKQSVTVNNASYNQLLRQN